MGQRLRSRGFTLIELLVVIAILGILATFVLSAVGGARNKAKVAIAKSQIKSLATALEAYNTDVGYYPRDRQNIAGADIPHLLFAALNNKPTTQLGGGPNSPYYDTDRQGIGVLIGPFVYQRPTDGMPQNAPAGEEFFINARPLNDNENQATAQFQGTKPYNNAPALAIMTNAYNGYPVYVDPFGNSYHYREWASKPETIKENSLTGNFENRANNFNTFDIWSNGADAIDQFGHPDSDDVTNWGR